jgi:NAD(P) transhydrogenase subunit alpha
MKIAVPRETAEGEARVALTPQSAAQLIADGNQVLVEAGAGEASFIDDEAYREAGASVVEEADALYRDADLVLRAGKPSEAEVARLRSGQVLIGTLGTLSNPKLAQALA